MAACVPFTQRLANQMDCTNHVILVVEDDHFLRFAVVTGLSAAGFDVREAQGSEEAIDILSVDPTILAVFTDVEMPGRMDGLQLASFIHKRWPSIKIIIASGRINIGRTDIPEGSHLFTKPYNTQNVARILHGMVETI